MATRSNGKRLPVAVALVLVAVTTGCSSGTTTGQRTVVDAVATQEKGFAARPADPARTRRFQSMQPNRLTGGGAVAGLAPATSIAGGLLRPTAAGRRPGTAGTLPVAPLVRLLFDHGSATLTRWDRGSLREVAKVWRHYGGRLKVIGHANRPTDARAMFNHNMANFSISLRRAARIRDQLVRYGVDRRTIDVTALSDTLPAPAASGIADDPRNRRAEVYLIR